MKRLSITTTLLAAVLLVPAGARGQPVVDTTELRQRCESASDHIVRLPEGARVAGGPAESATSGCKIIVAAERTLELDSARIGFAGSLEIQGGDKSKLLLKDRSELEAPATAINLGTFGNALALDDSAVRASKGDLEVSLGSTSFLQLQYGVTAGRGLTAADQVRVLGGRKLLIELKEGLIAGERGLTMDLRGEDIALKSHKSQVTGGAPGGIDINSFSLKTIVELKESRLISGADLAVRPDGMESLLKAVDTVFSGAGVTTLSASGDGARGVVELVGSPTLVQGRRVIVQASPDSRDGVAKVTQIRAEAGAASPAGDSDLIIRTGTFGTTEVKGSSLFAARALRITAGAGGTCKQESNEITAPLQELCP